MGTEMEMKMGKKTKKTGKKQKTFRKKHTDTAFAAAVCAAALLIGMAGYALGEVPLDLSPYISVTVSPTETALSLFGQRYTVEPRMQTVLSEWALCAEKAGRFVLADKGGQRIQKAAATFAAAGKHIGTGIGAVLREWLYGNL